MMEESRIVYNVHIIFSLTPKSDSFTSDVTIRISIKKKLLNPLKDENLRSIAIIWRTYHFMLGFMYKHTTNTTTEVES